MAPRPRHQPFRDIVLTGRDTSSLWFKTSEAWERYRSYGNKSISPNCFYSFKVQFNLVHRAQYHKSQIPLRGLYNPYTYDIPDLWPHIGSGKKTPININKNLSRGEKMWRTLQESNRGGSLSGMDGWTDVMWPELYEHTHWVWQSVWCRVGSIKLHTHRWHISLRTNRTTVTDRPLVPRPGDVCVCVCVCSYSLIHHLHSRRFDLSNTRVANRILIAARLRGAIVRAVSSTSAMSKRRLRRKLKGLWLRLPDPGGVKSIHPKVTQSRKRLEENISSNIKTALFSSSTCVVTRPLTCSSSMVVQDSVGGVRAHCVCVVRPAGFSVGAPGAGPPHQHQTLWRPGNDSVCVCVCVCAASICLCAYWSFR